MEAAQKKKKKKKFKKQGCFRVMDPLPLIFCSVFTGVYFGEAVKF